MKLAVAATAPLGAAVLEDLADRHDVELLVTRLDRPRGRGRRVGAPPAKETAERLGVRVEQPERLTRFPGDDRSWSSPPTGLSSRRRSSETVSG